MGLEGGLWEAWVGEGGGVSLRINLAWTQMVQRLFDAVSRLEEKSHLIGWLVVWLVGFVLFPPLRVRSSRGGQNFASATDFLHIIMKDNNDTLAYNNNDDDDDDNNNNSSSTNTKTIWRLARQTRAPIHTGARAHTQASMHVCTHARARSYRQTDREREKSVCIATQSFL